jgi:hypothetical protein
MAKGDFFIGKLRGRGKWGGGLEIVRDALLLVLNTVGRAVPGVQS